MMPLLKFYYHDGVRMAASYAMPEFVKCAKKYADANGPPPPHNMDCPPTRWP